MLQALIGPIASLAGTWLDGKVEKTKAEAATKVAKAKAEAVIMEKKATGEIDWEHGMPSPGPFGQCIACLLYTSPSPRDGLLSRIPSSA